jgi:hypothetical protein
MRNAFGAWVAGLLLLSSNLSFGDGNELLSNCNAALKVKENSLEGANWAQVGFCLGMIQGVTNLNLQYQGMLDKKALFCLPESGIESGQAVRIVVKYLEDHPEKLYEKEVGLVSDAFREAYPCQ